jgi:hypothetical protein
LDDAWEGNMPYTSNLITARKAIRPERLLREFVWVGLILFWAAYGVSGASFLAVNIFTDPRTLYNAIVRNAAEPAAKVVEANSMHVDRTSIALFFVAVIACLAVRVWRRTNTGRSYPLWYGAFGLLLAIPAGFLLSQAIPVEYVRDYAAYLKLAQNLYSAGDYSDVSEGNELDPPDVFAWRPPGVALLYGLPISIGVPVQMSVWLINSVIAVVVFFFAKWSLNFREAQGSIATIAISALVVLLSTSLLFLLPISHFPAIALLCLLLMLVPTESERIARNNTSKWVLAGLLIGLSALFRPNVIVEGGIVVAAVLIANQASRTRYLKSGAAVVACVMGIVIAIAPWTTRNWVVLHRFVPISTNGGMVFYSSNGSPVPAEQGHYVRELALQLYRDVPNEVDRDREGWRRGWANIASHPLSFLKSFQYRVPRLLANPLFPVSYIREQARDQSWIWIFPLFEAATLFGFWWLWMVMFIRRRSIRARIMNAQRVPWPQFSLLTVACISLLFENSPTFQLSFLPFVLFILFDASALPREVCEEAVSVSAAFSR